MLAAQGDIESLNKLYFAVKPLLYKLIRRYFPLCKNNLAEPDDLEQCGYFAVIEAVKDFSPDKGFLFNSYIGYHVKNACLSELGLRGKRQVETISLETPLSDDEEDFTFEDVISDPDADTYSYCELNDMRLIVRREIERLPPRGRCVIYGIFYDNKTIEGLAQELGWERGAVLSERDAAFNLLRCSKGIRELRKAYNWNNKHPSYLDPEKIKVLLGDSGLEPI